jgi:phosphatidylglycerophosphatase A
VSAPAGVDRPAAPPPLRGFKDITAHVLSVWFGCGHVPYVPGHSGTIGAIPLYLLVRPYGPLAVAATALVVTLVGIWSSGRVERRLGIKDPQIVVIDEVAGVLVAWTAAPPTWRALIVGGLAFRLFDWLKPWPARRAERLPGGPGVMLDDVAAGFWGAALVLAGRALGWL